MKYGHTIRKLTTIFFLVFPCASFATSIAMNPTESKTAVVKKVGDLYITLPESHFSLITERIPTEVHYERLFAEIKFEAYNGIEAVYLMDKESRKKYPEGKFLNITNQVSAKFSCPGLSQCRDQIIKYIEEIILPSKPENWDTDQALLVRLGIISSVKAGIDNNLMPQNLPQSNSTTSDILAGLSHKNDGVRYSVIRKTEYLDIDAAVIEKIFELAEKDSSIYVRREAMDALRWVIAKNDSISYQMRLLHFMQNDEDQYVRYNAASVLSRNFESAYPYFREIVFNHDAKGRLEASNVLIGQLRMDIYDNKGSSYQQLPEMKKEILQLLTNYFFTLPLESQRDLLEIPTYNRDSNILDVPFFAELVFRVAADDNYESDHLAKRKMAVEALSYFNYGLKEALKKIIFSEEVRLYPAALDRMGKGKVESREFIPRIIELTQFSCNDIKFQAEDKKCNAMLVSHIRYNAAEALGRIRVANEEVISALKKSLGDDYAHRAAQRSLQALGIFH